MGSPIHQIEGVALDSTSDMVADSLGHRVKNLTDLGTGREYVYPNLTDAPHVVSANADWTLGAFATLVAANQIASDFHISDVCIEACDQNAVFELVLYYGASDTEAGRVRFAVIGGFWGNSLYAVNSVHIPANSRVRMKIASSDGLANQATLGISIAYKAH